MIKTCKRCREEFETNDPKQDTHVTVDVCTGVLIAVNQNHHFKMMDELGSVNKKITELGEILMSLTKERDDFKKANVVLREQVEKVKREADGHMDSVQESFRKEREQLMKEIEELKGLNVLDEAPLTEEQIKQARKGFGLREVSVDYITGKELDFMEKRP